MSEPHSRVTTITRYSAPHKYDHAPAGSQCMVLINENEYELYVQTSLDDTLPRWEYMGIFSNQNSHIRCGNYPLS